MFNAEGSFARKHLEKLGWADGRGLGAGQQGISQAIRVKIKHDTTGVGHDPAKEFSDHWWDHVFHKAAASLVVKNGKDGAVVEKKIITQKERTETAKKALYGNFIKGHLLADGTETQVEKEGGGDTDSSDDETKARVHTLLLPDDELFEKCGGRTAHKGARHGLKLNGKLARIQAQERHLAANNNHSSSSATSSPQPQMEETEPPKKKKKSKKRKREEEEEDCKDEADCTNSSENVTSSVSLVERGESFVEHSEDSSGDSKKKKKKKKKKERVDERESDEDKERRKDGMSDKESEENQIAAQEDVSVSENGEAERKREKKKRKKEKKEREREEKRKRAELEEGQEVDESNVTLEDTSTTIENEEKNATKEKRKDKKKKKKERA